MKRERSGFLLPGVLLTALACVGVVIVIASAVGVLPDEVPILRSAESAPRRNASVPAPDPTTPAPSPTATPSVSPSPSRTRSSSPSASSSPRATASSATKQPAVTVTASPSTTRSTTPPPPPPPSCKAGSATVTAVADAYVDQAAPTRNFGGAETLQVTSRDRSRNRRALLRFGSFAVPKGCTVTGGTLTMTARDVSGRKLLVARATEAWSESGVTWANGPAPTGYATGATVSSAWITWSLPVSTVTSAYGFVVYDAAENAKGDGEQTNLAGRVSRGAPTLTIRWS